MRKEIWGSTLLCKVQTLLVTPAHIYVSENPVTSALSLTKWSHHLLCHEVLPDTPHEMVLGIQL